MPKLIKNGLMAPLKALESCEVKCEAGCLQYICFPRYISISLRAYPNKAMENLQSKELENYDCRYFY